MNFAICTIETQYCTSPSFTIMIAITPAGAQTQQRPTQSKQLHVTNRRQKLHRGPLMFLNVKSKTLEFVTGNEKGMCVQK